MAAVSSDIFKNDASAYVRRLFRHYLSVRWYVPALIVLPFTGLSFVNVNFIYVALMALFIVAPMLLGFVYVYYAFSEECVMSIRRGRVEFDDTGIEWVFCDDDGKATGRSRYRWSDFNRCEIDGGCAELYPKGKGLRFLLVPLSAFDSDTLKSFIRILETL